MIKKISFSNYKAFKNADLELKPITILLGENSSGKSSILQLIMLLTQTMSFKNKYESALKLNGKFVSLGEPENIFSFRDTKKKLSISIEIDNYHLSHDISRLYRNLISGVQDVLYELNKLSETLFEKRFLSEKEFMRYGNRFRHRSLFEDEDSLETLFDMLKKSSSIQKKIKGIVESNPKEFEKINSRIERTLFYDTKRVKDALLILDTIRKIKFEKLSIEYKIGFEDKKKQLRIDNITIRVEDKILLAYGVERTGGKPKTFLKSELIDNKILNKYRVEFGKHVVFSKLSIITKENKRYINRGRRLNLDNPVLLVLHKILKESTNYVESDLDSEKINYVNPLRAFPKRYYLLDEANVSTSLNTVDGNNLTEVLKKDKRVKSLVNKWLNNFNLSVNVEGLRDVIHKLKIKQHDFDLDITDVGFGISQVLPVIVQGFLTKPNSLTIIEQPEIHLHPKMQADLADLFIDIISSSQSEKKDKILLIETHSESLLKRLRRRMAEKNNITNKDVAIYFIRNRKSSKGNSTIERIEISETGSFEWPIEFYSTDIEDTSEYLKHQ